MSILDNELVWKYFGPGHVLVDNHAKGEYALRVLQAMEEPIKKGELAVWYRQVHDDWVYGHWDGSDLEEFHPFALHVPDRFQPAQKAAEFCDCGCGCGCSRCKPTIRNESVRDLVEGKIREILWPGVNSDVVIDRENLKEKLRELVELARASGRAE